MALKDYKKVIANTIARFADLSPEELTDKILERVELAMEIAEDVPASPVHKNAPPVPIVFPKRSTPPIDPKLVLPETGGGIILEEAPPSPILSGAPDEGAPIEYWTPDDLRTSLSQQLPNSLTLRVPGVDQPITLTRAFEMPPQVEMKPGVVGYAMGWVRVRYRLPQQAEGPMVTVLTTEKEFDVEQIKSDVASQASAWYRKEVPVIRGAVPPNPAPDLNQLMQESFKAAAQNQFSPSPEDFRDAAALRSKVLAGRGIRSVEDWTPRQ